MSIQMWLAEFVMVRNCWRGECCSDAVRPPLRQGSSTLGNREMSSRVADVLYQLLANRSCRKASKTGRICDCTQNEPPVSGATATTTATTTTSSNTPARSICTTADLCRIRLTFLLVQHVPRAADTSTFVHYLGRWQVSCYNHGSSMVNSMTA